MFDESKSEGALYMFKDRLKTTCRFLFIELIAPIFILVMLVALIILVGIKLPIMIKITLWGMALCIGLVSLMALSIFINWLFIEPFKKNNKHRKEAIVK